ncbi:type III-B CRISPR module RAMP protein Cmr1 [Sporanaerobacter acetigenes]|uniref:type III-B CRISPR module RAMP protein Cmr1 n=1 Tax=Sporanaerobacter acetigenes TaxID=165813 RepID=UPI00332C1859
MNERIYTIELETLTPIWTGDATGKCVSIKESSIMGSLRWWYREVVRASGGQVCTDNNCNLSYKKFIDTLSNGSSIDEALNEQKICPVCKLFGCTGWAGKFKIIIESENDGREIPTLQIETREIISKKTSKPLKRNVEVLMFDKNNPLKIKIYPIKDIKDEEWEFLNTTINLISTWGALGGRTAQGNGVVNILSNNLPKPKISVCYPQYSNLNDFFFLKFHLHFKEKISNLIEENSFWTNRGTLSTNREWEIVWKQHKFLPIAFHIRDTIRRLENNKIKRHQIFGECRRASQIFVSHGYRIDSSTIEFRIWGYGIGDGSSVTVESIKDILRADLSNKLFVGEKNFIEDFILEEQLNGR